MNRPAEEDIEPPVDSSLSSPSLNSRPAVDAEKYEQPSTQIPLSSTELLESDTPTLAPRNVALSSSMKIFRKGEPTKDLDITFSIFHRSLITFALMTAGFMVGLDQSILGPAIPTIAAQFDTLNDIGLYTSAYLLPQCILQPIFNKIYSLFSFASVYIASVLLFGGGCLISATAQNSPALICGRSVSGIGAVGLSIGGFRLLALLPESKYQNLSMGAFSMILGSSIVLGPVLGGIITKSTTWHWIFWMNLPVLAVVLTCILITMIVGGPDLRGENYDKPWSEKRRHLDWLGTILLALMLTALILALQLSQPNNWKQPKVIVLLILFGISTVALIMQQYYTKKEMTFVPKVIMNRGVWTTCGLFFSSLSSLSVMVMFLPFLFQIVKGLSPQASGINVIPLAISITVGTLIFSIVSTKTPYFNPFALLGCICLLVASALFLSLKSDFEIPNVIGYEFLAGFGIGMSWLSEIVYPRASLDKHELAMSLGYTRMLQQVGATFSVQIATMIFTSRLGQEASASDLHNLLGGASTEMATQALRDTYVGAIRDGIALSTAWAVVALIFALMLPWPRLKGGITDRNGPTNNESKQMEESTGNEN